MLTSSLIDTNKFKSDIFVVEHNRKDCICHHSKNDGKLRTRGNIRLWRSCCSCVRGCGRSNVLESTNFRFCQEMWSFWNVNRMGQAHVLRTRRNIRLGKSYCGRGRRADITCERGRSNVLESTNFRFCQEPRRLNLSSFIVQPEAKASFKSIGW